MAKKKKYKSLDDLNAAQRKMNAKCAAIEEDLLGVVTNPLSLITGSGGSGKKKHKKGKNKGSLNLAGFMPGLLSLVPVGSLVRQIPFSLLPSRKMSASILRVVAKSSLKVMIVNVAIWGFLKIKNRIRSRRKKISN